MNDAHPLTGPVCPHCQTPFRRRRHWSNADSARCKVCGCYAEYVSDAGGRSFVFSRPDPRWKGTPVVRDTEKAIYGDETG